MTANSVCLPAKASTLACFTKADLKNRSRQQRLHALQIHLLARVTTTPTFQPTGHSIKQQPQPTPIQGELNGGL